MENSIEEDIEIIESIIEEYENCSVPEIDMQVNVTFREKQNNALNHILSDYKRVLKINEVLLKENEELKEKIREHTLLILPYYVKENYIPVQKIEDEIEELKCKLEDISKRREKSKTKEEETVLWCLEIRTDERIKTLHELLENYKMNPKQ